MAKTTKTKKGPNGGGGDDGLAQNAIIEEHINNALSTRYMAYALSTITQRALPDVRDGLKPVHRRILYAMRQLKLNPENSYKKCARIVGDVMGQYHPHGDASIYDALVKLSQSFSARYPLVDGQGNFGNIDGDSPAAMRYTEAKMTAAGAALLEGLDENAVDFIPTYNEEDEEPKVLPAGFPNLLANGSQGIAVGMATSIPPHNAAEICNAALHLIKAPNARIDTLMDHMLGPDLPTGGIIIEPKKSMLEAYKTGKGGFKVRSRWSVEDTGRGMYQIIVTEIPYQVQKSRLIEKLAEVIETKKRQADSILNMRLRALNKLQEIEIKGEYDKLAAEKAELEGLVSTDALQWAKIAEQIRAIRDIYGLKTETGARRTTFDLAPDIDVDLATAFITKEPVTIVLSDKGWIRALKGKVDDLNTLKFKEGDELAFAVHAETTDKIIVFASNGKFYTLGADKLPGGRGNGEPIRLMVDLENDHVPIGLFVHNPERELLVASSDGYGFRVNESDVVASTRGGRKTLNVKGDAEAVRCIEITGDKIATIGENRKILIFDVESLPEMTRGKGVRLQKYKDGGLVDITTFKAEDGLVFVDSAGRRNDVPDWVLHEGKRAGAGRMAPRGSKMTSLFGSIATKNGVPRVR